jgi:hypothetical protein
MPASASVLIAVSFHRVASRFDRFGGLPLPTVAACCCMILPGAARLRSTRDDTGGIFHIFSGVRLRCTVAVATGGWVYRARVARIRSPRRGGHRGGGLARHVRPIEHLVAVGRARQARARPRCTHLRRRRRSSRCAACAGAGGAPRCRSMAGLRRPIGAGALPLGPLEDRQQY